MSSDIHLFTSESVSPGHPDKVSDQISDAILDAYLAQDPNSRVACETLCTTGLVLVAGEITSEGKIDIPQIVRDTITRIGYTDPTLGFDAKTCAVITTIDRQSPDISQGVTEGDGLHSAQGAGDQGLMFGYACDETDVLMPLPIILAHRLMEELTRLRTSGDLPYLRPDGKGQVTVEYHDGKPHRVHTVVISTQHSEDVEHATLESDLIEKLVKKIIPGDLLDGDTIYHMNPTGRFVHGGPYGDTGVTGRKIIVDTYGGKGSHGGGAFSGKDPSKVDRSATYAARYVAKNIVAAELATQCEVQLAYAIGVSEPISILVDTSGTGIIPDKDLVQLIRDHFDLTPKGIIDTLDLKRPIYSQTACYGHFGRELDDFTWEKTDKAEALKAAVGKIESHQTEKAPVA